MFDDEKPISTKLQVLIDISEVDISLPQDILLEDVIGAIIVEKITGDPSSFYSDIYDEVERLMDSEDGDNEDVWVDKVTGEIHNYDIVQGYVYDIDNARDKLHTAFDDVVVDTLKKASQDRNITGVKAIDNQTFLVKFE